MIKFVVLGPKTHSYLKDHGNSDKKANGTKQCAIKGEVKFKNYEDCNNANQLDSIINIQKKMALTQIF